MSYTQEESLLHCFQRLTSYTRFLTPEIQSYVWKSQPEHVHIDIPASLQRYEHIRAELNNLFNRLKMLRENGLIEENSINEILEQKISFEEMRVEIEEKHRGKIVVICNGEIFVDETIDDAVRKAKEKHGNRPYYSEAIGIADFPSVYF